MQQDNNGNDDLLGSHAEHRFVRIWNLGWLTLR